MSVIVPISNKWGSKAAALDAYERVDNDDAYIALWIDEEGSIMWSKANMNFQKMSALSAILNNMVNMWADDIIEE